MAINLLALQPHKVSRDLSGYIVYLYGEPKTGKTSLATQVPGALLVAFERGYNALPGVIPQDVMSWAEFRSVVRELKKPEVQKVYKSIIIDTVDIAASMCEKYICDQNDVENLTEIPYGGGWSKAKKEFEDQFRTIAQLGYALVFISHAKDKTFKNKDNSEYNQIVPSCGSAFNEIVKGMADIYCYAEKYQENGIAKVRLILRSIDNSVDTGSRFKYIAPSIEFSYQNLVKVLNDAIDEEAKATNNAFVTDERASYNSKTVYDFDALMKEFNDITSNLMTSEANQSKYGPIIVGIIDKNLGKGKKISNATRDQADIVSNIIEELKEAIK